MKQRPILHTMPRVFKDIRRCVQFVARQPWGRPADRARDIWQAVSQILEGPELNEVGARRPSLGFDLRRHNAAQFAIVYTYIPPNMECSRGVVSLRAVRHSRVKNVFSGVREPATAGGGRNGDPRAGQASDGARP